MKSAVCSLQLGRAWGASRSGCEVTRTQSTGEPPVWRDHIEWEVKNKGGQENKQQIAATSKVADFENKEGTKQMGSSEKLTEA